MDDDGRHSRPVVPGLDVPTGGLRRVRATKGRRQGTNIGGLYYWGRTQAHVWCESQEEMHVLRWLDFEGRFAAVYSQPFVVIFERGRQERHHTPDFLLVDPSGRYTVINVKPSERRGAKALRPFELMEDTCRLIGWEYQTFPDLDPRLRATLTWLAGSRHPRCAPPEEKAAHALSLAKNGMTRHDLARGLDLKVPARAMPWIDHLLWTRKLTFDLTERLCPDTVLHSNQGEPR